VGTAIRETGWKFDPILEKKFGMSGNITFPCFIGSPFDCDLVNCQLDIKYLYLCKLAREST